MNIPDGEGSAASDRATWSGEVGSWEWTSVDRASQDGFPSKAVNDLNQ